MKERLKTFWNALWFTPASRTSYIATRAVLCLYSLWLLMSRPSLWRFVEWPAPFRQPKYDIVLLRFAIFAVSPIVEHALYIVLFVALIAALFGVFPRLSCFLAAILLYHFAVFEEVLVGVQTNGVTGFTLPVLGLLILSFTPLTRERVSPDYRWPVVLIQFLFSLNFLLGGLSKFRYTGITWYRAQNVADTMREMATLANAPWALSTASRPWLVWAISIATLALELLFPLAVVSKNGRRILVPAAFVAHWIRTRVYGFYFMSWPLLLLFINWDWLLSRFRRAQPSELISSPS